MASATGAANIITSRTADADWLRRLTALPRKHCWQFTLLALGHRLQRKTRVVLEIVEPSAEMGYAADPMPVSSTT